MKKAPPGAFFIFIKCLLNKNFSVYKFLFYGKIKVEKPLEI